MKAMHMFVFLASFLFLRGEGVSASNEKSFAQKLHGADIAHQKLHKSQMLDQLAAAASPTSTTASTSQVASTTTSTATLQIYPPGSLPTSPSPPDPCITALSANINCDPSIQLMGANPFFDTSVLGTICTNLCLASLESYRSDVISACGNYMLPGPGNISYVPTVAIDTVMGPYQQQCLTDSSTGLFCNAVLPTYSTSSGLVLGYPNSELCTSCVLGTLQITLQNPLSFSDSVLDTLQTALGVCGSSFNSYNVTSNTSMPAETTGSSTDDFSSNLAYSPACYILGRNITTSGANNTCNSVASQFSITGQDILLNNPTLSTLNCTAGFGAGVSLCIPQACTLYTVPVNQTCQDVVDAANSQGLNGQNNITVTQLQSFNPNLGNGCSNIGSYVGSQICIGPHGGFPTLGDSPTDVSKPSATITATAAPPGQTAPGTTDACGAWYLVQPDNFCLQVVLNNTITLDDFLTLNPEESDVHLEFPQFGRSCLSEQVNANCTNLWANYYYCVAPFPPLTPTAATLTITSNATSFTFFSSALPTPDPTVDSTVSYPIVTPLPVPSNIAPGSLQFGCNYYYNVSGSDNCTSVESLFGLSESDFEAWNPGAASSCPTLTSGQSLCVLVYNASATFAPAPTNVAAGTITTFCEVYYTVVSGDSCSTVETKNNVTDAQFRLWNPEINTDCTNLELAEAYCVAMATPTSSTISMTTTTTTSTTPSSSSSTTSTTTVGTPTTTSATSLPTNIAAGTWSNCTTYYTIVSGDSCTSIEATANIAISDFLRWNPEVTTNCDIDLAEAYCINGPSPCETIHTVASGDFCFAIASDAGITVAQLMALNPFIDANCDLQIGWNLCIAAAV